MNVAKDNFDRRLGEMDDKLEIAERNTVIAGFASGGGVLVFALILFVLYRRRMLEELWDAQ